MDKNKKAIEEDFNELREVLLRAMIMDDSSHGFYLQLASRVFVSTATVACSLHIPDEGMSVKEFTEGFMGAITKDVLSSVAMSCKANGWEFHPDPNKELRDELISKTK